MLLGNVQVIWISDTSAFVSLFKKDQAPQGKSLASHIVYTYVRSFSMGHDEYLLTDYQTYCHDTLPHSVIYPNFLERASN